MDVISLVERMLDNAVQPSPVILDILAFESDHKEKFVSTFKGFLLHFEHAFELIVRLLIKLNYIRKDHFPAHRPYQLLLFKNSVGSIYSAFDRLKKGFYVDALSILRLPFETIVRIMFISYYPEAAEAVLTNKLAKGSRQFHLKNFLNELDLKWHELYHLLSMFSHSNNYETIIEIGNIRSQGQKEPIAFRLKYDEKFSTLPMNVIYFTLTCFLRIFLEFFLRPKEGEFDKELQKNTLETLEALEAIMNDSASSLKEECMAFLPALNLTKTRKGLL